jgi:outer membrane protein
MRRSIVTFLALILCVTEGAQEKKWTLLECVTYALDNNISIKQQELTNETIAQDIRTAEGNYYPSVNLSSNYGYNFGSFIGQDGSRISRDSRGFSFNLNTGVVLFNANRNKFLLEQAKKNLEAAGFDLEENKNNIMLFVVNSYLNVLLNREALKIAEDQVVISTNQVKKAQGLVEAGEQPKTHELEAQATLATHLQQLTTAENNLDISLLSLAQLLQLSHKGFDVADVELTVDSASLIYNDTDDIFNTAVANLPEIKSAEVGVENANVGLKIAKSNYYPRLSFGAGLGSSYQHSQGQEDVRPIVDPATGNVVFVPNGFGKQLEDNLGYNLGFSLSVPIFNGFQTKAGVSRAEINQDRAELLLLDKKIKLRENIERAYADAKAALKQYVSAETSLSAQEVAFRNAQESYNSGVMTSFDFDQVRNRLVNAQSTMINAKYNFVFRTKLLEYYYGIPITID